VERGEVKWTVAVGLSAMGNEYAQLSHAVCVNVSKDWSGDYQRRKLRRKKRWRPKSLLDTVTLSSSGIRSVAGIGESGERHCW